MYIFLSDVLKYNNLSTKFQAYIAQIAIEIEPKNFKKAVKDQRWIDTM